MKAQSLSLILASSLSLGFIAPALAQNTQTTTKHEADREHKYTELLKANGGDVDPSHWASESIEKLITKYCGIMVGYPDNTFRGDRQITRYEMGAALYKLMQCLEEVELPQTDTSNLALKEDLKALANLQDEFKNELDAIKAEQMNLAKRIDVLEQVQVHGSVELRYRERLAVTDGTFPTSPLYAPGNSSPTRRVTIEGNVEQRDPATENTLAFNNNVNQYGRDEFGVPNLYHSPSDANISIDDLAPFRLRTQLDVQAQLTPWAKAEILLEMFDLSQASSGLTTSPLSINNGGHDGNEGMPDGSSFIFRQALAELTVPNTSLRLRTGLMNLKPVLNTGTRFTSLFNQSSWNGRGYGFVGWGGSEVALSNTDGNANYRNSIYRYWNGGINSSMVDPDSMNYNQVAAPGLSADVNWGWGSLMVGGHYGSPQTNRLQAAQGNLSTSLGSSTLGTAENFNTTGLTKGAVLQGLDLTPNAGEAARVANHLALPSQFGDGYGVVGLDTHFLDDSFPIRFQVAAMSYFNDNMTDFSSPTRKEISGTLDLGWDKNFGMTLQANKSFIGFDRHSLGLFFNDIASSGIDIQLGANLATRGLFNIQDSAGGSAGAAVGIPIWKAGADSPEQVKVILAARQSLGNRFGNLPSDGTTPNQLFKDSGITVSVPWVHVGNQNIDIYAQYSMLMADALWDLRPVAQDISLITRLYW